VAEYKPRVPSTFCAPRGALSQNDATSPPLIVPGRDAAFAS